jgi:uncharacterized membrane protein YqhA
MFKHLLKIRYLAVVVVLISFLHALAFLYLGVEIAVTTYGHMLHGTPTGSAIRPGLELLHSLDMLLVSLVMMILALGVAKLFLLPATTTRENHDLPGWMNFEDFGGLKALLWETILTALLVISLSTLTTGLVGQLDWHALVIPAAILLLAVSLYFMKRA